MSKRSTLANLEAVCLALAVMLLLLPAPALAGSTAHGAKAQRGGPAAGATHGPSPRVVQAGAGTNASETNGNSGPKSKPHGNKTPPSPQPGLCKSYHGAVRKACLQTVVSAAAGSQSP